MYFIHGDMPEKVKRICKLYEVTEAEADKDDGMISIKDV